MGINELFQHLYNFSINNAGLVMKIKEDYEDMINVDIRKSVLEVLMVLAWQKNQ